MSENELQLLHEHYKDSCSIVQSFRESRERYFYLIVVFVAVGLFDLYAPRDSAAILSDWIRKRVDSNTVPDLRYIRTVIWFVVLGLTVRYCQAALFIERQYKYLHALEDLLAASFPAPAFTREGKAYLASYPAFSTWAHYLYTLAFPLIVLLISTARAVREIPCCRLWTPLECFDFLLGVATAISIILYLVAFHGWGRAKKKGIV